MCSAGIPKEYKIKIDEFKIFQSVLYGSILLIAATAVGAFVCEYDYLISYKLQLNNYYS